MFCCSFSKGLCSHQLFNRTFGHFDIQGILCINVLRIMRQLTCFKYKMTSLQYLHIMAQEFVKVLDY